MKTSTEEEVQELLKSMERDIAQIKEEVFKNVWYMRGGITLDQMFQLGMNERQLINRIIKENLDITKKTRLPFY